MDTILLMPCDNGTTAVANYCNIHGSKTKIDKSADGVFFLSVLYHCVNICR